MHVVPISYICLYDCMLVVYVGSVGIPMCHIFPCIILVTRDFGRILVILYVMLSLSSLGLTMGIS
jgi:hypothetical protein